MRWTTPARQGGKWYGGFLQATARFIGMWRRKETDRIRLRRALKAAFGGNKGKRGGGAGTPP